MGTRTRCWGVGHCGICDDCKDRKKITDERRKHMSWLEINGPIVFWLAFAVLFAASLCHCEPTSTPTSQTATISFVGDINFTKWIGDEIDKHGTTWPFEKVKSILAESDFRVANLENPAGVGGAKYCVKSVYFKANPKYLDALTDANFNLVSLANNHALDYGPDLLLQTEKELDDRHILHMGIVANEKEENKPIIKEINGIKFGFLAYCNACPEEFTPRSQTAGVVAGYSSRVVRQIKKLKPLVDFVIVFPHWGTEYAREDVNQIKLAQKALDAGADIIIGAHPHVLQKIEQRLDGKIIVYSLGNFIFPMRWEISMTSTIVNLRFNKINHKIDYNYWPISLINNRPELIIDEKQKKRVKYIIENGYGYLESRKWPKGDLK